VKIDLPKPNTSGNRAKGQYGRDAFRYIAGDDEYECPAGQRLVRHRKKARHCIVTEPQSAGSAR
jgi:hypothetical protein